MTDDRDFKQLVRRRAAKTGESYQAARRQLVRQRPGFSAQAVQHFRMPVGVVLGCVIERGEVTRGMNVTVTSPGGHSHRARVVSLRHMWMDLERVSEDGQTGQFGLLLDPPYIGPLPAEVSG